MATLSLWQPHCQTEKPQPVMTRITETLALFGPALTLGSVLYHNGGQAKPYMTRDDHELITDFDF